MPLPGSGVMTLNMIKNEFGQSGNIALSRYYRGGPLVPQGVKNNSISTWGRISHSMFYGASKEMTATEAAQLASDGRLSFSRENSQWNGNNFDYHNTLGYYQNGVYNRAVFPNHKWGAWEWNYDWYFYNTGFAPSDAQCTVVILGSGRGAGAPSINYVRHQNGSNVGFRAKMRQQYDNFASMGEAISVYEVDCDRRDVVLISTYHTSWPAKQSHCSAIHVLPGGNYAITSRTGFWNAGQGFTLNAGEFIGGVMQATYWSHPSFNVDTGLACSADWGLPVFCLAAYAPSARTVATEAGVGWRGSWYSLHVNDHACKNRAVILRKMQSGENAASLSPHHRYATVQNRNDLGHYNPLTNTGQNSGSRTDPTQYFYVGSGRGAAGEEEFDIVSWSCDNPNIAPVRFGNGYRISTNNESYYYDTVELKYNNFNATLSIRATGVQVVVNSGPGVVRYWYYNVSNGD